MNAYFQCVALNPRNWPGLGSAWARATSKTPNLDPQVALCWTQLSWSPSCQPIGHVGLQLGPNRPRWAPNSSHVMHMEVQMTPKVAHLGTFWRQFQTDTQHVIETKKIQLKRGVLKISDWAGYVPHCDAIWASTWAEVALKWVEVEAKLRHLGAKFGRSWSQVGPSWAEVGALCCGHFGSKRCICTILCRYAKCANYDGTVHFSAAWTGMSPPG